MGSLSTSQQAHTGFNKLEGEKYKVPNKNYVTNLLDSCVTGWWNDEMIWKLVDIVHSDATWSIHFKGTNQNISYVEEKEEEEKIENWKVHFFLLFVLSVCLLVPGYWSPAAKLTRIKSRLIGSYTEFFGEPISSWHGQLHFSLNFPRFQ